MASTSDGRIGPSRLGAFISRFQHRQYIAKPAHGLDHFNSEFLAQTTDENLDCIGIAVKILLVEMLDDLAARHDPPGMVHQVRQQPVLVRGKLDRAPIDGDPAHACIEVHRAAMKFTRRMTSGAPQQSAQPGKDFLDMEGFGDVVVGHRSLEPCRSSDRVLSKSGPALRAPHGAIR
jgi:hypothetical protein